MALSNVVKWSGDRLGRGALGLAAARARLVPDRLLLPRVQDSRQLERAVAMASDVGGPDALPQASRGGPDWRKQRDFFDLRAVRLANL